MTALRLKGLPFGTAWRLWG